MFQFEIYANLYLTLLYTYVHSLTIQLIDVLLFSNCMLIVTQYGHTEPSWCLST